MQDQGTIFKILLGLACSVVVLLGILVWFVKRILSEYDRQITVLFQRTECLTGMQTDIKWLKKQGK